GPGGGQGSPGHGRASTSRKAAVSRTVRVTTPSTVSPAPSTMRGPFDTRPRADFSPTSPQAAAGIRIEPPPSLACAAGAIPAATAAAAPPDEPPALRRGPHGPRAGGATSGSVYGGSPRSGVVVLPTMSVPASRSRMVTPSSAGAMFPRNAALPISKG